MRVPVFHLLVIRIWIVYIIIIVFIIIFIIITKFML